MKRNRIKLFALILSVSVIFSSCDFPDVIGYVANLLYTDEMYISDISDALGSESPLPDGKNPFDTEEYNGIEDKYGFGTLSDDEKELYKRIYSSSVILTPVVKAWDLDLTKEAVPRVMHILVNDHPELFYLSSAFNFLYKGDNSENDFSGLELIYSDGIIKDGVTEDGKAYTEKADRELICEQIYSLFKEAETFHSSGTFGDNVAENAKAVHDRLVGFCSYDSGYVDRVDVSNGICDYQSNAFGALVKNSAVCSGITAGATLLLNRLGIRNAVCYGKHGEVWHIWNMVETDGNWYHFDATWDMSFFPDNSDMYCYEYFLLGEDEILSSRSILSLSDTSGNILSYKSPEALGGEDLSINKKITAVCSKNYGFNTNDVADAICTAMELNVKYVIIDMAGSGNASYTENMMSRIYYSGADNVAYRKSGRLVRFTGKYFITEDKNRVFLNIMCI